MRLEKALVSELSTTSLLFQKKLMEKFRYYQSYNIEMYRVGKVNCVSTLSRTSRGGDKLPNDQMIDHNNEANSSSYTYTVSGKRIIQ